MSIFGDSPDCRVRSSHRKPLITIWAETRGVLNAAEAEWSFGASARGVPHLHNGYPMACGGRIMRMALSVVGINGGSSDEAIVSLVVDGMLPRNNFLRKDPGEKVAMITLTPPIEVAAGSVINFISRKDSPARSSIVSLLIELDL